MAIAAESLDEGADGAIYLGNRERRQILRVDQSGTVTKVYDGDVRHFAIDSNGNLFVSDRNWVDKITPAGDRLRMVGNGGSAACGASGCPSGSPASALNVRSVGGVEVDRNGNLYVLVEAGSGGAWELFRIRPGGEYDIPGSVVTDRSASTQNIAVDPDGRVHVPSREWYVLTTAGDLVQEPYLNGYATVHAGFAPAAGGVVYVTNELTGLDAVGRFQPGLIYDTIAGGIDAGFFGDGGPAAAARFNSVRRLLLAQDDSLYISDWQNQRVRRIRNVSECPSAGPRPLPAVSGFRNAASYGFLSPGAVFTFFGVRFGPPSLVMAALDNQNRLPTELEGTRVFIDGVSAPLLYTSEGQVSGIVPYETRVSAEINENGAWTGTSTPNRVVIQTPAGSSDDRGISVFPAVPAIFTVNSSGRGPAAALNQDGTLNSAENRVRRGEIFVIWATGFGAVDPVPEDGAVLNDALPEPTAAVEVTLSGEPTELLYAGAAPGMVAGVMQVNARVLQTQQFVGETTLEIKVGNARSASGVLLFTAE